MGKPSPDGQPCGLAVPLQRGLAAPATPPKLPPNFVLASFRKEILVSRLFSPRGEGVVEDRKAAALRSGWLERELLPLEPWLRGYLLLSRCPVSDIDDVVQDCFLRIFAARSIDKVSQPRGLLKRVARNLLIDRHRRRLGVEFVGLDAALELPSGCCPQDELIDVRRTLARVTLAIDAFPARGRDIVERRCLGGQSSREAAAELGVCSSTIDKQLRASIAMLRCARDGAFGEYADIP